MIIHIRILTKLSELNDLLRRNVGCNVGYLKDTTTIGKEKDTVRHATLLRLKSNYSKFQEN